MSQPYHRLTCECGEILRVLPRHAGETRRCPCGNSVQVPTWREIQRLPRDPADESSRAALPRDTWSVARGLTFAGGVLVLLICVGTLGHAAYLTSWLQTEAPSVDDVLRYSTGPLAELDVDRATLLEVWEVWKPLRDMQLDQRPTPRYLASRRLAEQLRWRMMVAGGISVVALCGILGTLRVARR